MEFARRVEPQAVTLPQWRFSREPCSRERVDSGQLLQQGVIMHESTPTDMVLAALLFFTMCCLLLYVRIAAGLEMRVEKIERKIGDR